VLVSVTGASRDHEAVSSILAGYAIRWTWRPSEDAPSGADLSPQPGHPREVRS
jgi:hypothetical protein